MRIGKPIKLILERSKQRPKQGRSCRGGKFGSILSAVRGHCRLTNNETVGAIFKFYRVHFGYSLKNASEKTTVKIESDGLVLEH